MDRLPPLSQIAKIASLLALLVAPFIPHSLRHAYLYFLFNVILVMLGIESGFLAAMLSGPRAEDKKPKVATVVNVAPPSSSSTSRFVTDKMKDKVADATHELKKKKKKKKKKRKMLLRKCSLRASIFVIGAFDGEGETEEDGVGKDDGVPMTRQELYAKSEKFIGNFYRQLRMQDKESSN